MSFCFVGVEVVFVSGVIGRDRRFSKIVLVWRFCDFGVCDGVNVVELIFVYVLF